MSRYNLTKKPANPYGDHLSNLHSFLQQSANNLGTVNDVEQLVSMESLGETDQKSAQSRFDDVAVSLESHLNSTGLYAGKVGQDGSVLTAAQVAAGSLAASAFSAPHIYARQALKGVAVAQEGINLVAAPTFGAAGLLDVVDGVHPSLEAFDERELRNSLHFSVQFNIEAARQDEFSELFYKTIVVGPDQAAVDVTVGFFQVHKEIRHTATSDRDDWKLRSLIEAHIDPTILADEETRLYAVLDEAGKNAASFVDPAVAGSRDVMVSGFTIETAPLKVGKKHNLIGLSEHAELLANGIYDNTDALDARLALETLYIQLADGEAAFPADVSRLPLNSYLKTIEGQSRDLSLRFSTEGVAINGKTLLVDQTAPAIAAQLEAQNLTVHLAIKAFGDANAQFGTVRTDCPAVEVAAILDADGNQLPLDSGTGLTIVQALADAVVAGVDYKAYRTNSNRRTRGTQLDVQWMTDRYVIPLGSPISCPAPITTARDASDLKALVTAVRIRNSNNAVTTLLNYAAALRDYVAGPKIKGKYAPVEGMGRYLVTPFFEELELDMEKEINSLRSWDKAFDVSACIVNAVRDMSYRMYQVSGYQPALDAHSGPGSKPELAVGTDQVIVRHLQVSGDTRTFGTIFDKAHVACSVDERVRGKIFLTYVRPQSDVADPLGFGNMAWIPELTSSVQVNRQGATIKESMVQPRSRHFNNLPILGIITVTNLDKVLQLAAKLGVVVENAEPGTPDANPGTGGTGGTGGGTGGTGGNDGTGAGTTP